MTVRLRERHRSILPQGGERSDEGVSPVIGMILVLAISVVGIVAILYWGLPAIDEMKASVEYRSVTTQFTELDATIKELVAGTTEKTAKRWQPALNRGSIVVESGSEGWLLAADRYSATKDYDFVWYGLDDGDHTFQATQLSRLEGLATGADVTSWTMEAYIVTGTASSTQVNVSLDPNSARQMTAVDWVYSTQRTFYLFVKGEATATPQRITGATFKFEMYSGSGLVAEAWYMNTGRIDYDLASSIGNREIVENNGALMVGTGDAKYTIINSPPIPPPTQTGGTWRFFGRMITMTGDTSFAGDNRYDILISLYSTATLASHDCALASHSDCVETAKIFIYGDQRQSWHDYFMSGSNGYKFAEPTKAGVTYLEQRETYMAYTLLGSTVLLAG